jgi:hypothetical protein
MLYTHCFVWWVSLTGPVFISVPQNVCSVLKMVPDASEFLGSTLNLWDDDSALVYCVWRTISCLWIHYRVDEFFWIFIEHQIMSYVFNFIVKILLILTYDLCSVDQTMNDSPFYRCPEIGTSSIDWVQLSRFYLKTETESGLRNAVFWKINRMVFLDKDRMLDNVQKHNICTHLSSFFFPFFF